MRQKITIYPGGKSKIEGLEKSDECYKLGQTARAAGKVVSEKDRDHTPVHNTGHVTGRRN